MCFLQDERMLKGDCFAELKNTKAANDIDDVVEEIKLERF